MANAYRKRSSTGATGVKRTITQKQGGGVKTTTSQKTGSSSRVAFTRNANGSAVQTTTRKTGDGYIIRQSKTLVPKYKPVKHPKPPKMPKLTTTVMKEKKPRPLRAPRVKKGPRPKKVNFNWLFASPRRTNAARRSTGSGTYGLGFFGTIFLYTKWFLFLMIFLAVFNGIFGG